jgi:hypothetical protein
MKRDLDLVRKILLAREAHPHGHAPNPLQIEGYTEEQVGFHAYLMEQAGLVEAGDITDCGAESPQAFVYSLTWDGYEFLEATRNEETWAKARRAASSAGGMVFDVLKSVCVGLLTQAARKAAGLP